MSTERNDALRGQVAHLTSELARARADAKAERARLTALLETETTRRVDERTSLILAAQTLAPGIRWDGREDADIQRDALAQAGHDLSGRSDEWVAGVFALVTDG